MSAFRALTENGSTDGLPSIVRLWILRMLVRLGVQRSFVREHDFTMDDLAEALGLGDWVEPTPKVFDSKQVRAQIRTLYRTAEREAAHTSAPEGLRQNIARIQQLVGLTDVDCRILEFAALIHTERLFDDLADSLGGLSTAKVYQVVATLLDLPEREVRGALSSGGILGRSGLLTISRQGMGLLRPKLDLLSENFADAVCSDDADPVMLLQDKVALARPATLTLLDYEHIAQGLATLRPYLRRSVANRRVGVNVFLHGDPGTGKSELARVLARDLDADLFEVASQDIDGDPVNGERRLRAFRAAQTFFAKRRALIVFDEVEDVFNDGDSLFGRKSTAQTRKAWLNRMLEDNSIPTLWLSNSIRGVDPAFIRRFDLVLEVPVPPKKQRQRILEAVCADLLPQSSINRLVQVEDLAPAVVTRAAAVVSSIREDLGPAGTTTAFELVVDNTLKAQGHRGIRCADADRLPEVYDPTFIQADANLGVVATGLARSKAGRLCLYGPPGTGKSAYARWLAEQIGVPLNVKRASDLMSMWVGGSEKNIAKAFTEAADEGALLLIDEVDSFLQDRRTARTQWEVTLVNEMLTQMESFPGVFVASTNLVDEFDPAALRRFDLKVKFSFLGAAQAAELLRRYCAQLALPTPATAEVDRVSRLHALTPGDFAAAARQHRFRPMTLASEMVGALEAECSLKPGVKAAIGFV